MDSGYLKYVVKLLPLVALFLITLMGVLAINELKKEIDVGVELDKHQVIDLPSFSFVSLYDDDIYLNNFDFKDKKYSILSVFASWCTTCLAEHSVLLRLAKNKNISVYGIAFRDIDKNTKKFLVDNGNPFKVVGVDRIGELSKILSVSGVPETFLINGYGQVVYRHKGLLDEEQINYLLINR
jgi:cytochrome c biogenesis protein CcmG/thiol:disulfide interchange protein DsbE